MRLYETTFILNPELDEAELDKNIERYKTIITGAGGTLEKEDRWGMRRMAYEIQKKSQGYYVHFVHNSEHTVPHDLERQFLLNEDCLRYLTVTVDPPKPKEEEKPKDTSEDAKPAEAESASAEKPAETPATENVSSSEPTAETAEGTPTDENPAAEKPDAEENK